MWAGTIALRLSLHGVLCAVDIGRGLRKGSVGLAGKDALLWQSSVRIVLASLAALLASRQREMIDIFAHEVLSFESPLCSVLLKPVEQLVKAEALLL